MGRWFLRWYEGGSVQSLSHIRFFWLHGLQHARLPCSSPTLACSNSCPLSLILCHLLLSPLIFLSIRVFSSESVHQVAKELEFQLQLQHQSFQWIFRICFLGDKDTVYPKASWEVFTMKLAIWSCGHVFL